MASVLNRIDSFFMSLGAVVIRSPSNDQRMTQVFCIVFPWQMWSVSLLVTEVAPTQKVIIQVSPQQLKSGVQVQHQIRALWQSFLQLRLLSACISLSKIKMCSSLMMIRCSSPSKEFTKNTLRNTSEKLASQSSGYSAGVVHGYPAIIRLNMNVLDGCLWQPLAKNTAVNFFLFGTPVQFLANTTNLKWSLLTVYFQTYANGGLSLWKMKSTALLPFPLQICTIWEASFKQSTIQLKIPALSWVSAQIN